MKSNTVNRERDEIMNEHRNLEVMLNNINRENERLTRELELIKKNSNEKNLELRKLNMLNERIERATLSKQSLKDQIVSVI